MDNKSVLVLGIVIACLTALVGCTGPTSSSKSHNNENSASEQIVGGGCDGCELMYVGMPKEIESIDTNTGWTEKGQKLIILGTVFKLDGKTPAPNVVMYYWQTDHEGYYSPKEGMNQKARLHGHLRGWVKSDENGKYAIYTVRPAPYPDDVLPAHIHISVKEPNAKNEYYIDDLVFDDDKFLTADIREASENRGGSGILKVLSNGKYQVAEHDIILGLNIPNYEHNGGQENRK